MREKFTYIRTIGIILVALTLVLLGNVLTNRDDSHAADGISIELDGQTVDPSEHIQMTTSSITLTLKSSDNIYSDPEQFAINWTIESEQHKKRATITNGTSSIYGILTALEPGEVQIMVNVVDKSSQQLGIVASASCWVDIIFSIDTIHDDNSFKFLYDTDTSRSLVKYTDSAPYSLDLAFGTSQNCQWTTENDEVVKVSANGVVTPVGAGRTNVVATYTPTGDTQTYTAYLPVYIFPKVSLDDSYYFTGGTYGMASGDIIYTDAFFGPLNTETIQEKLVWVIKKDINGVRTVIEDSLGNKTSDMIKIEPHNGVSNTSNLVLTAKAGNYYIEFYPYGAYKSESEKTSISPTVINLTVYAGFGNFDKTILVNDGYNLAEAFNMNTSDFLDYFVFPTIVLSSGGDASNYVSYSQDTTVVSALQKGIVTVTVNAKAGKENNVINLCNPNKITPSTSFTITIRIIDSFTLDRTSVVMYAGQSLQLTPTYTSYSGVVTWSSSNTRYVTVTSGGRITALKETLSGEDVTITATLELDDGTIKKATCIVKVEASIDRVTISPSSLTLQKGEVQTLVANFTGNITVAPFTWRSTDKSVCTVSAASDGKSALVTAVNGGTSTVVLTNTENMVQVYCTITVTVPIEKITLTHSVLEAKLYTEGTRLTYTIAPSNATDTALTWVSSNLSVATVDQYGVVTFKAPGTTLINVYPKNNPNNTFSQCMLTVIKTADSMALATSSVTMNAGDTYKLDYTVSPANSVLDVAFTSADTSIATVDRTTGLITAKKAGMTQIFANGEGLDAPAICNVRVLQNATGISFVDKEIIVQTGTKVTANVNLQPADSTDAITWTSLDSRVASVSGGVITGVSAGTTYVQAKAASGVDAIVAVHVRDSVKALALSETETTMTVGDTLTLTTIFTPAEPYNKDVKWSTTNASIATVNDKGLVTAMGGGVVVIKCVANDGGYQATCIINVKEKVASITLNHTSYKLGIGKKVKLVATVNNPNATNQGVTWSTSNKKIAKVSKTGRVTGLKIGTCTIKATAKDGSKSTATCKIRVVRQVTSIKLNRKTASVFVGSTFQLKRTIRPTTATIKSVKWESSDSDIASVDKKGNVVGESVGIAKITVTTNDGTNKSATCLVSVRDKVSATSIIAAESQVTIAVNTSANVKFTMNPANSTDKVSYVSDNPSVASVNAKGKIYGKSIGSATVYATTSSGQSATVDVKVVGLNRSSLTLRIYDKQTLWVNGINSNVKWYSQNPLIATVEGGKVVGRKVGTTTIYAVVDGTRISCKIRVTSLD